MKFFIFLFLFISYKLYSQSNQINENGYNKFYYENGNVASEGYMKEGKPDGYWKNYYENGKIKSEGNRRIFMLDSVWKFYNDDGLLISEIYYKEDKKISETNYPIEKSENFVEETSISDTKVLIPKKDSVIFAENISDVKNKNINRAGEYLKKGANSILISYGITLSGIIIAILVINPSLSIGTLITYGKIYGVTSIISLVYFIRGIYFIGVSGELLKEVK